jgi:8-oxo-dGTP diphosphatase
MAAPAGSPQPQSDTAEPRVVVGAAITVDGRVLAAARAEPPQLAGMWEFPGGKVEPGESEPDALRRECREELGVDVEVAERIGPDLVAAGGRYLVRIYRAELLGGEPVPHEHSELRWLAADELDDVPWLPGNRPVVDCLPAMLTA